MDFWQPSCTQKALFLHLHCRPPGPRHHRLRQQLVQPLEVSVCGGDAVVFHRIPGTRRVRCLQGLLRTSPAAARQTTLLNDETCIIYHLSLKAQTGKEQPHKTFCPRATGPPSWVSTRATVIKLLTSRLICNLKHCDPNITARCLSLEIGLRSAPYPN